MNFFVVDFLISGLIDFVNLDIINHISFLIFWNLPNSLTIIDFLKIFFQLIKTSELPATVKHVAWRHAKKLHQIYDSLTNLKETIHLGAVSSMLLKIFRYFSIIFFLFKNKKYPSKRPFSPILFMQLFFLARYLCNIYIAPTLLI